MHCAVVVAAYHERTTGGRHIYLIL